MSEIAKLAINRWADILKHFGVADSFLNGKHQACPFCGGTDRARYTDYAGTGSVICNRCMEPGTVDGFEFLQRLTGRSFKSIATEIKAMHGTMKERPQPAVDSYKIQRKLNQTWNDALPIERGDPVHRYLLSRKLQGVRFSELINLRHHPRYPYWATSGDKPELIGHYPAMIGRVCDSDGVPVTLHITYLTNHGGKAAVEIPRKILTPMKKYTGGAVRLNRFSDGQVLCVAEGIETALAVKKLHPHVCSLACLSAGTLQKFSPPDYLTPCIWIASDNDESYTGQAAAFALAKRLVKKTEVKILMPDEMGTDFCDQVSTT